MKISRFGFTRRSLLLALTSAWCVFPTRADDAAQLAQAAFDRPAGRDLTTLSRMELTEKGRTPRVRELVTYRLNKGRGEAANLLRFVEPRDIAGTGLLSNDKADGSNEQWLYLPELDRVRRISGDRKGGRFVGSDLTFEDLQERKPAQDRHRLVGKEAVDGVVCDVIESVPLDAADSVYLKRIRWIDPQTQLTRRVDYFEKNDATPSKRWLLLAARRIQGYWAVTDSRVTDLNTGHETRMVVTVAQFDRKLPLKLFTSQALADENIESEYRP